MGETKPPGENNRICQERLVAATQQNIHGPSLAKRLPGGKHNYLLLLSSLLAEE